MSFFCITACISMAFGQNTNSFMGVVKIKDTLIITYKLEFKEVNGEVSGFSLTDFGGEHETKSKILGKYDRTKNLLSYRETELIYTKSPVSTRDFCNIHLEPTKFKLGSEKLMAKFKGKFNDGTECLNGEIAMNSVDKINKRVTKFTKKVLKSKRVSDSIKDKLRNTKLLDTLNLNILKKNQITSVLTSSKSIQCIIYDGGQIDDDIITVLKNGKIVLYKYKISETKKILDIPLTEDSTRITIVAVSEGSIGESTAVIEIHDGVNEIKTMTNLKKDEKTNVDVLLK